MWVPPAGRPQAGRQCHRAFGFNPIASSRLGTRSSVWMTRANAAQGDEVMRPLVAAYCGSSSVISIRGDCLDGRFYQAATARRWWTRHPHSGVCGSRASLGASFLFPRPGFGMCRSRPLSAISQSAAIRNRHAALTWALRRRSKPHKDIYCRRSRASSPGRRFDAQNVRMVSPRTTARSNILKDLIC